MALCSGLQGVAAESFAKAGMVIATPPVRPASVLFIA